MDLKGTSDHIHVQEICINESYGEKKTSFLSREAR